MKIDKTRIKKSTSEVPAECQALIERLRSCNEEELLDELKSIETWTYGKCELYHWIDILDLCDGILEAAAAKLNPKSCQLSCDKPKGDSKELLLWVLHFTTLLIEHSFSRHLYNSMEHLLTLMSSCDLNVLLGVLNLLYMFSKRSNFLTRLTSDVRLNLLTWLTYLAENWGGKEHGFGLADCCRNNPNLVPSSATTLHHEFYTEESRKGSCQASCIHIEHVDKLGKNPSEIMDSLTEAFNVPKDEHIILFTHVRLAYSFSNYNLRLKCVQARLQALSVLLYSNSFSDCNTLLYTGLLDELVELLELKDPELEEIHSAALRTLTSILHLDRNSHLPKKPGSRLNVIIDVTGAGLYHGFLPQLVRTCINLLTGENTTYPLPLATALFSFLYHLASYETGGEALVSCGMMECLLRVINWNGTELEHITFVTRAVRVIDLITNIDMQGFQSHSGLASFINRLEMEIDICRVEQPYVIYVRSADSDMQEVQMDVDCEDISEKEREAIRMSQLQESQPGSSKDLLADVLLQPVEIPDKNKVLCLPQRAALLKSMLNFLKKALQDPAFSESIRHVMDGSLPATLKHIVSNPDYYGPSLFLLATDVVAVYVFQEPSLLSSLQDNGLTDVVLHALLVKNVPSTREVLGSLPNVFSALCLNARGLSSFIRFNPFDRLFRVLLSPMYLVAMRRRRSSDPIGDTAANLGNAMDELMRHQPALKSPAIAAIIELLKTLCQLGRDPKFVCWKPQKALGGDSLHNSSLLVSRTNDGGSSDEEDDDEEEASTSSHPQQEETTVGPTDTTFYEKTPIALIDYIMNVMKFVDAILSNNSTDDHCREFVSQGGLAPLLSVLALPNLPVDFPIVPAAQSVASVCKSILNLAHEPQVMKEGLSQLYEVLETLEPLYRRKKSFCGSVLLEELAHSGTFETAFTSPLLTPLLHAMVAAHGYVSMFVYVCRTGQLDIRTISMTHWGSELGLRVLDLLSHLYTSLVWESTVLLTLCCQDSAFGLKKEEIDKLCPYVKLVNNANVPKKEENERLSPYVRLVDIKNTMDPEMFQLACKAIENRPTTSNSQPHPQTHTHSHQKSSKRVAQQQTMDIQYLKPLLGVSSRLGRALAELFGLLVKLCVGFPVRTRRGNHLTSTPVSPTPSAQAVATSLAKLLTRGLNSDELPHSSISKFKLTFLICSVGFTSPMLFDEKKFPYHLMLQKFVRLNGQAAFFSAFRWALTGGDKFSIKSGLENPKLPETTGEFLDAWLMLLEKMVNPKAVLESTHMLPPKPTPNCKKFDPVKYLQRVHKMAFLHLAYLWGKKPLKTYGARMTETMLTIFKHILRGEKLLEDRKNKESDGTSQGLGTSRSAPRGPEVNMNEMTHLMDMGFSRDNCYEALVLTATLERATDYLLSNFFPTLSQIQDEFEEEEDEDALKKEVLDEFTAEALSVCLELLEVLPETVYRVAELLNAIMRRNGEKFTYDMLGNLAEGINFKASYLLNIMDSSRPFEEIVSELVSSPFADKAATLIHLYMLLFEEVRIPCANVIHSSGMLPMLNLLVTRGTELIAVGCQSETPKWLAPILLLIDLLEKVSYITHRKADMHNATSCIWRWFDLTTGKWCLYMPNNNKLINESYWRGDKTLRIASGRRRYTIMFQQMVQTNEDSGKQRPIMMTLRNPYRRDDSDTESSEGQNQEAQSQSASEGFIDSEMGNVPTGRFLLNLDHAGTASNSSGTNAATLASNISSNMSALTNLDRTHTTAESDDTDTDFFHRRTGMKGISGLKSEDVGDVVRACVQMMKIPVDPDTLHAAMQVCVRYTRSFENARITSDLGIVKILLQLTQASTFNGFTGLATILIRHILEEPLVLHNTMEKILRTKVLPSVPPSYKELHYVLRECGAIACRNPEVFENVVRENLRVDTTVLNKRNEEDDPRLLMKALIFGQTRVKYPDETAHSTINDLINSLIIEEKDDLLDLPMNGFDGNTNSTADQSRSVNNSDGEGGSRQSSSTVSRPSTRQQNRIAADILNLFPDDGNIQLRDSDDSETFSPLTLPMYMTATAPIIQPAAQKSNSAENLRDKKRLLLSKAAILKILGDAVRSYPTIAKFVSEHKYLPSQSDTIKEECTAIAYVLDNLMVPRENNLSDLDRPSMARMLIAAIASSNHAHESQITLVSEVKAALARTMEWPESAKKHSHIQDLVGIVTIMIEHCPPVPINSATLTPSLRLNQFSVNNMVRYMIRKGIIADLAHIPHQLDLSSPKMPVTMNAVLKPLETLARLTSQPTGPSNRKQKQSNTARPSDDLPVLQRDNNSSGIIHIEGDENNEEAGHARHDEAAGGNSASQAAEITMAAVRAMDLSPDPRSRMNFSTLRFQQPMDNSQLSPPSSSEDSDSNSSNDGVNNMDDTGTDLDLQEDDDDDEDDNNQGDENGEDNGGNFDEEGLEVFASDAGLFRIPLLDHDSEDLLMIEYSEPDTSAFGSTWHPNSSFPVPFSLFDEPTTINIDNSVLGRIPTHHPLLMTRQNVEASNNGGARPQRLNRPRRYQYLHMNRSSAAPVFLQRLMSDQTFMQTSNSGNSDGLNPPFGGNTRVIVLDNGLGILTNAEEEQINFVDQSGYLMGPSLAATLSNVPTALHWWTEESKLVDGESQPDQSLIIAFKLAYFFERLKIDEICSHKEKKKKQDEEFLKKASANGKDSDKNFLAVTDGIITALEIPQPRPPTRPSPNRRIAMLTAAQEVAQATGELAGSIVESVLHPRTASTRGNTFPRITGPTFLFTSSPSSPQSDPPEIEMPSGENGSNDILVHISEQIETQNIPAALELIPVSSTNNTTTRNVTDPMGLIPGSVPFPPPSDPDDGFFRVNPPPLVSFCDESISAAASPPHDNIFLPESQVPNLFSPLELDSWSQVRSQELTDNNCPALIDVSQSSPEEPAVITINSGDEDLFADEDEPQDQDDDSFEPEIISERLVPRRRARNLNRPLYTQNRQTRTREVASQEIIHISSGSDDIINVSSGSQDMISLSSASQEAIVVSSEEEVTMSQPTTSPPSFSPYVRHADTIRNHGFPEDRRRRRVRVISSRSRRSQDPPVSAEAVSEGTIVISSTGSSSGSSLEEVPEGVDPSFLAALPEEMRAEVLSEHIRLQRLQQQVESNMLSERNSSQDSDGIPPEVNPDFLAALPINIQEEVLAQQRLEQQRQAAASSNPDDPVDPVAFFQELPPSLRQSILSDMEDSQISVLPPELAAEAQNLRREWEVRNRQMMQDRFINHVANSTGALSSILRTTGNRGIRRTGGRLSIQNITSSNRPHWMSNWSTRFPMMPHLTNAAGPGNENSRNPPFVNTNVVRSRGKQVLDYESICCLLVLLFVDDARLNTVRLHRVFRHICCHAPTRDWVIHALLSIMERSNDCGPITSDLSPSPSKRMTTRSQSHNAELAAMNPNRTPPRPLTSWLNISMDAALGCRATVFQVHKPPGRRSERTISINPQAAPFVYKHALDILISLAKNFPMFFIPSNLVNLHGTVFSNQPPNTASTSRTAARMNRRENFWDLLIRLDSISSSKKGKTTSRSSSSQPNTNRNMDAFEISPFGQLLGMLGTPVVQRSQVLTDKLLKLLGIITVSFFCSKYHLDMLNVSQGTLNHLGVAVDLLTSNTCSEEGLEDATGLLLNVTVNIPSTRQTVLAMLLQSSRNMASLVRQHIEDLRKELRALNSAESEDGDDQQNENRGFNMKGVLRNRFTKDSVVVTVPKKIKAGMDLQLSSMTPLISKSSSQAFLLRILKVIVQLKCTFQKVTPKRRPELDNEPSASNNRPGASNNGPSSCSTPNTSPSASARPSASNNRPSVSSTPNTSPCARPSATVNNVTPEPEPLRDEDGNIILAPDSDDEDIIPATPPRPTRFTREPIVIPESPEESPEKSPEESQNEVVDDSCEEPPLCESLDLDDLWNTLSACLTELAHTQDSHAVLVLQPAVEAFFLVHSSNIERIDVNDSGNSRIFPGASRQVPEEMAAPAPPPVSPLPNDPTAEHPSSSGSLLAWQAGDSLSQSNVPAHQQKFLKFAETHRMVLNQILRQCTTPLLEGPFAVLVNHTRVLDFDVKRRYFRGELERADEGHRREELAVHIRRGQVFEDSFRELQRRSPDDWKNRFYIVFEGEEGQDAGGLLREWYMIISREIFNPMYALFTTSPGDRVTYMINQCSHCNPNHLCYFKFVGRVIAKAIYDNKLLECYFTRSFYKHILGIQVKYTDMESEDYSFYKGLVYLMENRLENLGYDLTFSTELQEFGVTEIRDLIPNGRNLPVTEDNKMEYVRLVCQMKMTGAIRKQLNAFLEGFYDIIPMRLISIFNEQELELLISGLPNVDIDDLKANTEYYKYQQNSLQIQWFWRALREFDQAERAKFLQFVTGTSKVPLQGFTALEGMNGIQKFQIHRDERSTDRLPSAHTCFNQLDLPVYETYTKLRSYLLKAIHECSEGFGFA